MDTRLQDELRQRKPVRAATRLAVVIVNFCQWRNTARLVKQLRHADAVRGGDADIVLVDNGSPNHPLAAKLDKCHGVRLLRNRRNLGFAKAVNRGVMTAGSEWALLLNPDVTVEDGFLDRALALIDELPVAAKVGAVGFQLRNADGSPQASTGKFPTFSRTVTGLLRPRSRRKCRHQSLVERDPVDWATGGCLLIRRECFQDLRGLDERYFLYYEDVDFCLRARECGWQVLYDPRLAATHHWPLHRRAVPAPLRLITRHALLTYAMAHWPRLPARLLAATVSVEARLRQMLAGFRGKSETAATYRELGLLVRHLRNDNRAAIARSVDARPSRCGPSPRCRTTPMREFSVVVPSHSRTDLLANCLQSLRRHAPRGTEIIVVDDGSNNGIISETASRFGVRILRHAKPRGFCAAVNAGIAVAPHAIVELLNDDAEVTAGWSDAILPRFEVDRVAAVTPVVRFPDGRIDSAGDEYDAGGFASKLRNPQRAETVRERRRKPAPLRSRVVKCVSACAAFYRRDAILKIGGFPEHFGAYFDDVDVSLRLRKLGYHLLVEQQSTVIHHGGQSHRPSRRLVEQQSRNEEWLYWRNNESVKTLPRHAAVLAGKALRRMEEGTFGPWLAGRLRALMASRW